ATLDPTMRRIELPGGGPEVILSDTVGFISDLPTELVAAFRATLEEVLAADLIVHVRDISHPETEEQAADVRAILDSLGVRETTPQIEVWNKIDQLDDEARQAVLTRAARLDSVQALSAVTGEGMTPLIDAITDGVTETSHVAKLRLGFDEGRKRAWLYERGLIEQENQTEDGFELTVRWSAKQQAQFEQL
ncbi:MAG: GTPase, partial [Roseovarius gahaiensis]